MVPPRKIKIRSKNHYIQKKQHKSSIKTKSITMLVSRALKRIKSKEKNIDDNVETKIKKALKRVQ
jgi:flagellin-specific chaperone FliS